MNRFIFILLLSFYGYAAMAADGVFAVSNIPPALLKNANAVLRIEEIRFEIINTSLTRETNHFVITILNENGEDWADFYERYNKYTEILSIEGILYDASGKQLKKIKKKDTEDLSGADGSSLIDDNRIRRHNFYYKVYPYTIEYTVETENKETLFFPQWIPQGGERLSVEKSSIHVILPKDYQIRYKAFNYSNEPILVQLKTGKDMSWAVQDLPAIKKESMSPMWHELATMVIFGPTDFQMDDYKGNMASWQDFGKFVYSLKEGRQELPENVKLAVHQIADPIKDPVEKISRLYEFMQKHTRYISIQLGIGGWQPFDAKEVASKGYGDCKALTNYMYSILKETGVNSYYTLVKSGNYSNYLTSDFPSQQFDHVILCVPLENDTMWLECTSQTQPAGYMGKFTADRYALLVDAQGGKLVRTPRYDISQNVMERNLKAVLSDEGTLKIKVETRYKGLLQDHVHDMINYLSQEKIKKELQEELKFATFDINRFEYKEQKKLPPSINETLELSVNNYASVTGKRIFVIPNVMSRSETKLNTDSARKYDIHVQYAYKKTDTVEIEFPKGFKVESMPRPVTIVSKFGTYSNSLTVKEDKLYYYRVSEQFSGRFPAKNYQELADFYNNIVKADNSKLVLVKE